MKAPELLAPAGSLEMMRAAFAFGADVVYAGLPRYSLRVRNNSFRNVEALREGVDEAHAQGRRFFVVSNVLPHNSKDDNPFGLHVQIHGNDFPRRFYSLYLAVKFWALHWEKFGKSSFACKNFPPTQQNTPYEHSQSRPPLLVRFRGMHPVASAGKTCRHAGWLADRCDYRGKILYQFPRAGFLRHCGSGWCGGNFQGVLGLEPTSVRMVRPNVMKKVRSPEHPHLPAPT